MDKIQDLNTRLIDEIHSKIASSHLIVINDNIVSDNHTYGICSHYGNKNNSSTCKAITNSIVFEIDKCIYSIIRGNDVGKATATHGDVLNYVNGLVNKIIVASPTIYTVLSMYGYNKCTVIRDTFSSIDYICTLDSKIEIKINELELELLSDSIITAAIIKVGTCHYNIIRYGCITL